ncbi:hypothetical protein DICA1_A10550 [Diutina catenulata]
MRILVVLGMTASALAAQVVELSPIVGGTTQNFLFNVSVGSPGQVLSLLGDPSTQGVFISDSKLACAGDTNARRNHHCDLAYKPEDSSSLNHTGVTYKTAKDQAEGEWVRDVLGLDDGTELPSVEFGLFNGAPWVPTLGYGFTDGHADNQGFPAVSANRTFAAYLAERGLINRESFSIFHKSANTSDTHGWSFIYGGYDAAKMGKNTTVNISGVTGKWPTSIGTVPLHSLTLKTSNGSQSLLEGSSHQASFAYNGWQSSISLAQNGADTIKGVGCAGEKDELLFDFGNGVEIPVPLSAIQTETHDGECISDVGGQYNDTGVVVIGLNVLHYIYAEYDSYNHKVTLARTQFNDKSDIRDYPASEREPAGNRTNETTDTGAGGKKSSAVRSITAWGAIAAAAAAAIL